MKPNQEPEIIIPENHAPKTGAAAYPYFYKTEQETGQFLRVPLVLFQEESLRELSSMAKLLYAFLLDRMHLSAQNQWYDAEGRVFCYYTVEQMQETLHCCRNKTMALMQELREKGLLVQQRQGMCKPNRLYVKNVLCGTGVPKSEPQEVPQEDVRKSLESTSGSPESVPQEVPQKDSNQTYINQNNPNQIHSLPPQAPAQEEELPECLKGWKGWDWNDKNQWQRRFREFADYDILLERYDRCRVDLLISVMADTVCTREKTVRIGGQAIPIETVRDVFLGLDEEHLSYAMDFLEQNTRPIRNIRAYLVTLLYNAPLQMDSFYAEWVDRTMPAEPTHLVS